MKIACIGHYEHRNDTLVRTLGCDLDLADLLAHRAMALWKKAILATVAVGKESLDR